MSAAPIGGRASLNLIVRRLVPTLRLVLFVQLMAVTITSCGVSVVPVPIELDVGISNAGACTVADTPVSCGELGSYISGLRAGPRCAILVKVDKRARYEVVMAALSSMQKSGFTNISFVGPAALNGGS
jgi:biopolymer transport protein ExbD